jgi:hypothetical protein
MKLEFLPLTENITVFTCPNYQKILILVQRGAKVKSKVARNIFMIRGLIHDAHRTRILRVTFA